MCAEYRAAAAAAQPRTLGRWASMPLIGLIRLYQLVLSPLLGAHCRFTPTCSEYGIEALRSFGLLRGSWLTARRILRCRPGGGSGYDPIPSSQAITE